MSNFTGVGIFWIGLNQADLGCWQLTLRLPSSYKKYTFCDTKVIQFFIITHCIFIQSTKKKKLIQYEKIQQLKVMVNYSWDL